MTSQRLLIIQLADAGEVLQTTPALAALRRAYPSAQIAVLVQRPLGAMLRGRCDAHEVIEWDLAALSAEPAEECRSKAALCAFVADLRRRRFDTVFNFSSDAPSALLTYLLKPRRAAGLVFCRDRRYRVRSEWMRYLSLITRSRRFNALNLADIFLEACATDLETAPRLAVLPGDAEAAEAAFRRFLRPDARPAVLWTAGSPREPEGLATAAAELAAIFERRGNDALLLRSEERRGCIEDSVSVRTPSGTEAAVLSLSQTASLLRRCRFVLTHHASCAQLAAAASTPCLVIAGGASCAWEEGPYGPGHYALQPLAACFPCNDDAPCAGRPCRDLWTSRVALAAVRAFLSEGRVIPRALRERPVLFSRSTWMPDGMLGLEPLNRPPLTLPGLLRVILRAYYVSAGLPVTRRRPDPAWRPWLRDLFTWHRMPDPAALEQEVREAAEALAHLERTSLAQADALAAWTGSTAADQAERVARRIRDGVSQAGAHPAAAFFQREFLQALEDLEDLAPLQGLMAQRAQLMRLARGCDFTRQALREFSEQLASSDNALAEACVPATPSGRGRDAE